MEFNLDQYIVTRLNHGEKILSYKGVISSDVINDLLTHVEQYFLEHNIGIKYKKKIYNILVESMQNLYHHSIELPAEFLPVFPSRYSLVDLNKMDGYIMLTTGNFVMESKVKALSQKIDKINTLSQDDLKEMYKFILNHQKLSAKGGGGLGMIDIARKSGHKISYEFLELNKDYYFYLLSVKITEE